MATKYIVDPLLVDKTFGAWILSRRFVEASKVHSEFSEDKKVLLELTCSNENEFSFGLVFHISVFLDLPDIVDQLIQQMYFSKNEMLETAKVFIPEMKHFKFAIYSDHTLQKLPKIEGVKILDFSNEARGVCFEAIFF
jgi:hypothetical protein